jgi:branched-chain amino acid transport system permease protein
MGASTLYLPLLLFLLSMMVVGGLGSAWGPLLGVAALMLVDEVLKEAVGFRNIGLGLILIGFVVIWPKGIAGAIEAAWHRLRRPQKENGATASPEQNRGSLD